MSTNVHRNIFSGEVHKQYQSYTTTHIHNHAILKPQSRHTKVPTHLTNFVLILHVSYYHTLLVSLPAKTSSHH